MAQHDRWQHFSRRSSIPLVIALVALLSFTFFFLFGELASALALKTVSGASSGAKFLGGSTFHVGPFTPARPKITIILVWMDRGTHPPRYLPYFFQSVENNPEIDLLFINVDKGNKGCPNHSNASNVKQVCMKEEECTLFVEMVFAVLLICNCICQTINFMSISCASDGIAG